MAPTRLPAVAAVGYAVVAMNPPYPALVGTAEPTELTEAMQTTKPSVNVFFHYQTLV